MKNTTKLIAGILVIAMLCGLMPVSVLATEAQLPETFGAAEIPFQINPLYENILSEDDLEKPEKRENPWDAATMASAIYVTEAEAIEQAQDHMKDRTGTFDIYVKASHNDYKQIAANIISGALNHTGDPREGDYLMWQYGGYGADVYTSYINGQYEHWFTFYVSYYTTKDQEAAMDVTVEQVLNYLAVDDSTDYEKVCAVYDYVCDNVTYDFANLEDDSYVLKYTAYAALIDGTAVCQGYAVLMYRLMLELGVDIRVIVGYSSGEPHAWNIVKLGDVYYNLDSTWDAGTDLYNFFLRNGMNFYDHSRELSYDTKEFHIQYPMSATDYVDGVAGEPASIYTWGYCGDNAYWTLDMDDVLTVFGEGPTYDYTDYGTLADMSPWTFWMEHISELVVEADVTYLGEHTFSYMDTLTSVTLPDTLEEIGVCAFTYCEGLREITFPSGVATLGTGSFAGCSALTDIRFEGDAPNIASDAFSNVTATAYYPADNATWTADVMQDYGGDITWVAYEPDVQFVGAALSLKGDIGLNFFVILPDDLRQNENAYMRFTMGSTVKTVPLSQGVLDPSDGSYRYAVALNAKNMGDNVTAQVYIGDTSVGGSKTLSIKYYADYAIANSSKEKLVDLMKAMLNYGAAAQTEFGYDTANLVNADMSEADQALPENVDVSAYTHTWSGEESGIQVTSASLLLQSETKIRIYFKLAEGKSISDFVFTVDGKTVTPVKDGDEYYIEKANIAAKDLDTMYTFCMGGRSLTYCGLSYVNQVQTYSKNDTDLMNLARALYCYNQAANAYFGA